MEGKMTPRKVLVTGGAGFIGSHLVHALVDRDGYDVRVLDSFATGHRENLADLLGRISVVEGDIRDLETVEEAVDGIDVILHEAALPSVPRSIRAPMTSTDVNVGGTVMLLSAARKAGVRRVVFASSSSVYGDNEQLPKTEGLICRPASPYAITKLTGEHYCRVFHELYGIETMALRYFNVFGPRQDPTSQYSGVIAKFAECAKAGRPFVICGDGLQSRDFTYVDNVVQANLLALEAERCRGEVVNVACGRQVTLLEVVAAFNGLIEGECPVEFTDARPGDVKHSLAAIGLAQELLGYRPTTGFEEGLRHTYAWYLER
jgi:nucleoside-diphosphate-sugar epimerase